MSEMFEAVVVCKPEGEVQKLVEALPNALNFLVREVKPFISSVVVQANRDVNFDVDRDKSLALHLSDIFEKSLLILYDNRVGFRFAALYENAELMREYNAQDEIWVLLDDSGESIRDGRTFSLAEIEIDSENEYECLQTTIDIGLAALTNSTEVSLSDLKESVILTQSPTNQWT